MAKNHTELRGKSYHRPEIAGLYEVLMAFTWAHLRRKHASDIVYFILKLIRLLCRRAVRSRYSLRINPMPVATQRVV